MYYLFMYCTITVVCCLLITYSENVLINKWVFSLVWNWSSYLRSLICSGNSFHSVGAEYENALDTNVTVLTFGTLSSIPLLLDLIFSLVFHLMVIGSCRYTGAVLCMHLNVRVNILYCIHWHIGSQWSVLSASVELAYLDLFSADVLNNLELA